VPFAGKELPKPRKNEDKFTVGAEQAYGVFYEGPVDVELAPPGLEALLYEWDNEEPRQ
jgi:hypothetical protein